MALDDLYQDILLDHARNPRHQDAVADAELSAEERNPSCGDHIRLHVERDSEGRITNLRHESHGCAISTASASMMSEFATGRTSQSFGEFADRFIAMMRGEQEWSAEGMEELEALAGVRQFPMRVKCATMCWHALKHALEKKSPPVEK